MCVLRVATHGKPSASCFSVALPVVPTPVVRPRHGPDPRLGLSVEKFVRAVMADLRRAAVTIPVLRATRSIQTEQPIQDRRLNRAPIVLLPPPAGSAQSVHFRITSCRLSTTPSTGQTLQDGEPGGALGVSSGRCRIEGARFGRKDLQHVDMCSLPSEMMILAQARALFKKENAFSEQ